jgi:hypothetical protein
METIKLWARNGDAVRQAIELGELVHLETASEELTDEFFLFAIQSGQLTKWADAFPAPRSDPERGSHVARDSLVSVMYATTLHSTPSSVIPQRTDRHEILGQKPCDFQRLS